MILVYDNENNNGNVNNKKFVFIIIIVIILITSIINFNHKSTRVIVECLSPFVSHVPNSITDFVTHYNKHSHVLECKAYIYI